MCVLSREEKVVMLSKVMDVINQREDKFMLAGIGPEDGRGREALEIFGETTSVEKRHCVII
jgi:hypothetical protein